MDFEENTWATLKSAISAIFMKQPDPCDLEKLYQVNSAASIFSYMEIILSLHCELINFVITRP